MSLYWRVPPQDAITWSVNILLASYWALPKEDQARTMDLLHNIRAGQPKEEAVEIIDSIVAVLEHSNLSAKCLIGRGTMPVA